MCPLTALANYLFRSALVSARERSRAVLTVPFSILKTDASRRDAHTSRRRVRDAIEAGCPTVRGSAPKGRLHRRGETTSRVGTSCLLQTSIPDCLRACSDPSRCSLLQQRPHASARIQVRAYQRRHHRCAPPKTPAGGAWNTDGPSWRRGTCGAGKLQTTAPAFAKNEWISGGYGTYLFGIHDGNEPPRGVNWGGGGEDCVNRSSVRTGTACYFWK